MNHTQEPSPRGLLLVDDHAVVRGGLRRLLDQIKDEWEITEAGSALEALECLRRQRFDLAVVDLSMPGISGLELIRLVKSEFPTVRMLALSMHAERPYVLSALKAGASGYVTKDNAGTELLGAVRTLASGGAYVAVPSGARS